MLFTKGFQQAVDLSAEMHLDSHAVVFQGALQWFGHGGAQQDIHLQLRHTPRQRPQGKRAQKKLLPFHLLAPVTAHDQQVHGCVEHGGDAAFTNGNGNTHDDIYACRMPTRSTSS
jgi:hypothetical protein